MTCYQWEPQEYSVWIARVEKYFITKCNNDNWLNHFFSPNPKPGEEPIMPIYYD